MQEQQKRRERRLAVLPAKADDRAARTRRVVVNAANVALLPRTELDRSADVLPFGDSAMLLDPADIPVAAAFLQMSQGLAPLATFRAAVAAACGVYRDWFVSRSFVAMPDAALVSRSRIFSSAWYRFAPSAFFSHSG